MASAADPQPFFSWAMKGTSSQAAQQGATAVNNKKTRQPGLTVL